MERLYKVSEVAGFCGVGPATIRRYEKNGKIPEPSRSNAGQRVYTSSEVEVIRSVFVQNRTPAGSVA